MSSNDNQSEEREEGAQAANTDLSSSQAPSGKPQSQNSETMKRAAAKQLIEKYFFQLTEGCGDTSCSNKYCASSGQFYMKDLTRNQAGVQAIQLFKEKAPICEDTPTKIAKVPEKLSPDASTDSPSTSGASSSTKAPPIESAHKNKKTPSPPAKKETPYLTEAKVAAIIEECKATKNWSQLIRIIGSVFNNQESLELSFQIQPSKEEMNAQLEDEDKDKDESEEQTDCSDQSEPCTGKSNIPKSDAAILNSETSDVLKSESGKSVLSESEAVKNNPSGDSDDDLAGVKVRENVDTSANTTKTKAVIEDNNTTVDIEAVRRTFKELFSLPELPFQPSLINALIYLPRGGMQMDIQYHNAYERNPKILNIFLILMEIPCLHSPEFIEEAFPTLCKTIGLLPVAGQAHLARIWSKYPVDKLRSFLESLQQLITVKVITGQWSSMNIVNDCEAITSAVKVLKILYYACIYGGKMDTPVVLEREKSAAAAMEESIHDYLQGAVGRDKEQTTPKEDVLGKELGVNVLDCREPLIPYMEFVNEALNSDSIEMDKDYPYYKNNKFSFMNHSFILTTATKNLGMYFDNRIRMINERRTSMLQSLVHGGPSMPYLRIRIRRDHIIDDALVGLEMAAMDNPVDLKKQLYVEFEGEQGIDEGGVQKEFFQLVVEAIFNPDIGMFTYDEETRNFWFNSTSFENDGQFTLIGIVLGLAIYNNVILDIHFPAVVYRKLLGKLGTFEDLSDSHPTLAKSLRDLLEFEGDIEETYMYNFRIGYKDVFGQDLTHDLKEHGDEIPVTHENKQEFVNLYADFLLNISCEKQFRAFKRGFHMVTDESPLKLLFRPEEVELLVCGSTNLDFNALEEAAEYDGGFDATSGTVKHFWEVVQGMCDDQKRLLLQFTTGSDRVPIGGLAKLKLIIARNGPDSERLPTAHTCFNVLLLPDYNNKEKLKERLLKAITHAKGFGML